MAADFRGKSLRILKEAMEDVGYTHLRAHRDLPMLLTFLERFDRLGWFPPIDPEKRRILAAHDVTMHIVRENLCFYEFCSKGARGERDPWLTIFFHVAADSRVRICGLEQTQQLGRRREFYIERIRARVEILNRRLRPDEES